ncbi:N-formylglutamate amidohydrolase [Alteromonas pelagimontana]|uniref:N-formylglutamate amidohydrolase n=1 Tax=Alteromonas pelagimontana TaxID=1858656 RepID=A0A6M4M9L0_9ALTE|nr:N-formylglutamate amidohydrolase [Alteromonas pelagimontana]QJR79360.1 N-formylglutamate amidohydrolase [Alteromonas pelagimontana]
MISGSSTNTSSYSSEPYDRWFIHHSRGPVMATAVHAGHAMREELLPFLEADDSERRREEDPMTDVWANTGDNVFSCYTSRFEVDLNRARNKACSTDPNDTWGMKVWKESPPEEMIERSLKQHDTFYAMMRGWLEQMIAEHGKVLLLDLHSYNHRRAGPNKAPASFQDNPDIDLGLTTLDHKRFGNVADKLSRTLADTPCQGRYLDVRGNVRYPDGGYWPEWVFANYGSDVCTITLEYKKFYMDEWRAESSLAAIEDLRTGLKKAVDAVREEIKKCR